MKLEVYNLDETLTEKFLSFCCDELNVYPDMITIEATDTPLRNNALGLCHEVEFKDEYYIIVYKGERNITEIFNTISHEMIHVKQFMNQNLSKRMNEHMPIYEKRWWEKEAEEKSFNLVKKYVDILYAMV